MKDSEVKKTINALWDFAKESIESFTGFPPIKEQDYPFAEFKQVREEETSKKIVKVTGMMFPPTPLIRKKKKRELILFSPSRVITPDDCCLYPFSAPDFYPSTDLPEEVNIVPLFGSPLVATLVGDYEYNFTDGPDTYRLYVESGELWRIRIGEGHILADGTCLIQVFAAMSISVQDNFPSTLTITVSQTPPDAEFTFSGEFTLTRVSLCLWEYQGEDSTFNATVSYGELVGGVYNIPGTPYKWMVNWNNGVENFWGGPKEDPQNTPIGTYEGTAYTSTVIS